MFMRGVLFILVVLVIMLFISPALTGMTFAGIIPLVVFFWWLLDVMFLEDGMSMYEPNYEFWREDNDTEW